MVIGICRNKLNLNRDNENPELEDYFRDCLEEVKKGRKKKSYCFKDKTEEEKMFAKLKKYFARIVKSTDFADFKLEEDYENDLAEPKELPPDPYFESHYEIAPSPNSGDFIRPDDALTEVLHNDKELKKVKLNWRLIKFTNSIFPI